MVSSRARVGRNLGTRINDLDKRTQSAEVRARTSDIDADDVTSRLAALEDESARLASPNYRAEQDAAYLGNERAQALLDPNYVGPGPASVYFTFESFDLMGPFEWKGTYFPWGSRVVNMVRRNGTWFIEGHTAETLNPDKTQGLGGISTLPLANSWRSYTLVNGVPTFTDPMVQRLHTGIVVLSGLIQGGTITSGTVIATLPVGFRPDTFMMMPVLNGNNQRGITIQPNGQIILRGSFIDSFITLDGIAFPAAGVATWTDIGAAGSGSSFGGTWVGQAPGTYGAPGYWKDPYGLVWLRGLVTGGNTTTDNNVIANMPVGYRAELQQHHIACSSDGFGLVGAHSTTGIVWKNGSFGTSFVSLAGITIVTPEQSINGNWYSPPFFNSWGNYDPASFPSAAVTRRKDGLGLAKGLIRNGTVGPKATWVPSQCMPAYVAISPRPAGAAGARVDLYGHKSDSAVQGQVAQTFGSNSWLSLDGMKWMVGEI